MNWKNYASLYRILSENYHIQITLEPSRYGYNLTSGIVYNLNYKLTKLGNIGWRIYFCGKYIRFYK